MSLLSDFFIALPDEVQRIDLPRSPAEKFHGVYAKRVDPLKLLLLQSCVEGSSLDEHLDSMETMKVREAEPDGPWIFEVPHSVCEALANARDDEIEQYGTAWAETEEWVSDGGTAEEIVPLLRSIALLAQRAKSEKKQCWIIPAKAGTRHYRGPRSFFEPVALAFSKFRAFNLGLLADRSDLTHRR
jgi:hypothetical protein